MALGGGDAPTVLDERAVGDIRRMRRAPAHPGEVFREDFRQAGTEHEISQIECARLMGMPANRLNQIEKGKRAVSPETAVLFEALTGISAEIWLGLQMRRDLWHAMQTTDTRKIQRIDWRARQAAKGKASP